jgi:hypothetical protein
LFSLSPSYYRAFKFAVFEQKILMGQLLGQYSIFTLKKQPENTGLENPDNLISFPEV